MKITFARDEWFPEWANGSNDIVIILWEIHIITIELDVKINYDMCCTPVVFGVNLGNEIHWFGGVLILANGKTCQTQGTSKLKLNRV